MNEDQLGRRTAAAIRGVQVDGGVLPENVEESTADGDVEVVGGLVVEDTGVVEGADEHHGEDEAEGANVVAEHHGGGLDADLDIVTTVLARVDGIWQIY